MGKLSSPWPRYAAAALIVLAAIWGVYSFGPAQVLLLAAGLASYAVLIILAGIFLYVIFVAFIRKK